MVGLERFQLFGGPGEVARGGPHAELKELVGGFGGCGRDHDQAGMRGGGFDDVRGGPHARGVGDTGASKLVDLQRPRILHAPDLTSILREHTSVRPREPEPGPRQR